MRKFSRCLVATIWLSRASANAELPTITQQHAATYYLYHNVIFSLRHKKLIKQTSLYLLTSANIKTMCNSHHTDNSRVASQRGGEMILRSGITTQSKVIERKLSSVSKQSKPRQHLPFLCTCFKSNGKQGKEMIAHSNRGRVESFGEVALNLLKGAIIVATSSFKRLKAHK